MHLNDEPAIEIDSVTIGDTSGSRKEALWSRTFRITPEMTNDSFAAAFCSGSSSYTSLLIDNDPQLRLTLPSCAGSAPSAQIFISSYLVIENWSHFPANLITLSCAFCRFGQGEGAIASNNDGWDSDGMVSWTEVFARFTSIRNLVLNYGVLPASLPTSLPVGLVGLQLESCGITGTLPSTLYSAFSDSKPTSLSLSKNKISGTIPSNLFAPLGSNSLFTDFFFDVSNNKLNGSLPGALLHPLAGKNLVRFAMLLQGNHLSGQLPSTFISSAGLTTTSFEVALDHTDISGPIPEGFFSRLGASTTRVFFTASNTKITGPLPNNLFGTAWRPTYFSLDLSNSKLNGTIPPGLICGNLQSNISLESMQLFLHNNDLEGSIPHNLLWNEVISSKKDSHSTFTTARAALKVRVSFEFIMSGNLLSGSIPSELFSESFPSPSSGPVVVDLSNNLLTSTIPQQILASFSTTSSSSTVNLKVQNNLLSGSPPLCPPIAAKLVLWLHNNALSGTIPTSWEECKFEAIFLDANVGLHGSIPSRLLNSTGLKVFSAANTSLDGDLPVISTVTTLILTNTVMDFCSSSSLSVISGYNLPSRRCEVSGTSACECVEAYTPCSATLNDTCSILEPSAEPISLPSPISPVSTPTVPETVPSIPESTPYVPESTPATPIGAPTSPLSTEPIDTPTSSCTSITTSLLLVVECVLVWLVLM